MRWWKNTARQPNNAPHVEGAGYWFHGTFRPNKVGDLIEYRDDFDFEMYWHDFPSKVHISIGGRFLVGR